MNSLKVLLVCVLHLLTCLQPEVRVEARTWNVATTSEFQAALRGVTPGDVVQLAPVELYGFFRAEVSGTAQQPITIQGSLTSSIISSWSTAFNLEASWYILQDFTVADAAKGIMVTGGSHNLLQNLIVRDLNEEGVHVRTFSSDNVIQNCSIYNTGRSRPGTGEGVYLGSDNGKWSSPETPDRSDRNIVRNNRIGPNVAGEAIDIKEGSCCGVIDGNYFDGVGMSNVNFDDSWIDIKGNDYIVRNNRGVWSLQDGIQIRSHMPNGGVSGCRNVIQKNVFDLRQQEGFGVYLASQTQCDNSTLIYDDNVLLSGGRLTNGWVTPA